VGLAILDGYHSVDIAFCHIVLVRKCTPLYFRRNGGLREFHGNGPHIVISRTVKVYGYVMYRHVSIMLDMAIQRRF
jgi:hypothetical protein